jgi:uncharacterized membrane protein
MRLAATVDIRAPAQVVFELLSAPERMPEWNGSVVRAQRLGEGPVQLGSRALVEGKLLGQQLESETEVVAFEPPRRFATHAVRGPRVDTSFLLESAPFGTSLRLEVSGDVPGGRLGGMLAERVLRKEFETSLERLKAVCEREASQRASAEPPQGGDPACWLHLQPDREEGGA